jgi:uncharacterized protein (DUF488 family)
MFYRRKIILALLQLFEGQLDKIRLQKLLFLFSTKQAKSTYDFVPYKFGCFSYSANADLTVMVARGLLNETKNCFQKVNKTNYLKQLEVTDIKLLNDVKSFYGKMSTNSLMKHTYVNFPFYAIKSEVAESILTPDEFKKVNAVTPKSRSTTLFTVGYQGISLEEYLLRLIKNDVKLLVDVRNNPVSMKYGFSKSQLEKYTRNLGIGYIHIPEVGITSDLRQELQTQEDYDKLFTLYRKNNLSKTNNFQLQILNMLKKHKRIALTCFESNICQCHRKHLAEAISKLPSFSYEVKHI